jgi:hypothetical protein
MIRWTAQAGGSRPRARMSQISTVIRILVRFVGSLNPGQQTSDLGLLDTHSQTWLFWSFLSLSNQRFLRGLADIVWN